MAQGSKLAVGAAIAGNSVVMVGKFVAFGLTGSAAMLSEALHSVADVLNQVLLMVGIVRSHHPPDRRFPFGYGAERYVWALMSAVGIFFLGCGVTVYHGVTKLMHPHAIEQVGWAAAALGLALVVEGYVLFVAIRAVQRDAAGRPFFRYLRRQADPSAVAVILEDSAACLGVLLAGAGIALSQITGYHGWDAIASIAIGGLLGAVAVWLIVRNRTLLVGPAVPPEVRERIQAAIERHPAVEKLIRLRTRQLDLETHRVAADIEFDGAVLADKLEDELKAAYAEIDSYEDFKAFADRFADDVVELLGDEVDAIEAAILEADPRARYLDIETE